MQTVARLPVQINPTQGAALERYEQPIILLTIKKKNYEC
jgi:hypothetical protein